MYEIMSERADMDYENAEACGAKEPHVDCSDAFNTSQVFECREDVLRWSDTNTGSRGRTTFVLIGCERSGEYRCRKKECIRRDTGTRKCGCPFKLCCKPAVGREGWMVKLICEVHNHELTKSLVGHPYAGRLTKAEKTLIAEMTKSMVKPRNILLTLKEHNVNSYTTIKQIYNARSAFRSSIRGSDLEMQHLMKLIEHSWSVVRNHLLKELANFSEDYIKLFGGTERFEELRMSLFVDGLTKVTTDKWMDITDMGHVIASRYNIIIVSLSKQQNMTFFPLRSQPLANSSLHRIICIGHVYDNHFVEVYLKEHCPLPPVALLWSSNCHPQAKSWPNPYISRMQHYNSFVMFKRYYVDINDD
ncbi:uncharacterized protein LOC114420528 [Glycine soja]|uniref:uncharacterized protein LOC114420528 n=1 Tax=Glycine soja TaxID=3848 RepID=UPI00103A23D6|nr:uncharacterized protein LOC114420528 [Glycine soja]